MSLKKHIDEIDKLQSEVEKFRPLDNVTEKRLFQKLRLDWNYHSNALEGNSLTYGETRAFILYGLTARGKPFKDYLDIRGHDEAVDAIDDIIKGKDELTEASIRELHKILLVEPYDLSAVNDDGTEVVRRIEIGRYKSKPNNVITRTGATHFFASPEETPPKMAELMNWYREKRDRQNLHPVILAATFHHQFVSIHPFDDGNGRMARILMNLILMQAGYLPIILRKEIKAEYIVALEKADSGEISDFIELIANSLTDSQQLYLRAARGEAIEDLTDFDKKINLIKQSLESQQTDENNRKTQWHQNLVMETIVAPAFSAITDRLIQLNSLFSRTEFHISLKTDGEPTISKWQGNKRLFCTHVS